MNHINSEEKMIKVANIIEEGRFGGPQTRIVSVAERLMDFNIETIVILPEKDNVAFIERLRVSGVGYKVLPFTRMTRRITGLIRYVISFPGDIIRLRSAIRDSRAMIVHCNGSIAYKSVLAAKSLGVPVIWHLNDTQTRRSTKVACRMLAYWAASGFIVAADSVAENYLSSPLNDYPQFLVPAPVDCNYYVPVDRKLSEGREEKAIKIMSTGNINPAKGVTTFVKMAGLLRKKSDIIVECVQVGAEFQSQKRYIENVRKLNHTEDDILVHMVGQQSDVRQFLKNADIYVCSSSREASPISVWEAMAMGLPIVATDVGDIGAMNVKGNFAQVVPVDDYEGLAAAVIELIVSPEVRRRLGENARQYAIENLDISICAGKHAEAYRYFLRSSKRISNNETKK